MRFSLVFLVLILSIVHNALELSEDHVKTEFSSFVQKFSKKYSSSIEEQARYEIFKKSLQFVLSHNELEDSGKGRGFRLGVMPWSDLTRAERRFLHNGYRPAPSSFETGRFQEFDTTATPPPQLDWRTLGAVTVIKDQDQCGSSPHFAVVTALEGARAIHQGKLESLSAQQIVDCASNQEGCDGSDFPPLFNYAKNGSCTAAAYPYKGVQGTCQTTCQKIMGIFKSYAMVPAGQESTSMLNAVVAGPCAAAINAENESFEMYAGGIYTQTAEECPSDAIDHGIAVVGYGFAGFSAPTTPFWILKNQWTTAWGEDGFMRVLRGNNTCGISDQVWFVK